MVRQCPICKKGFIHSKRITCGNRRCVALYVDLVKHQLYGRREKIIEIDSDGSQYALLPLSKGRFAKVDLEMWNELTQSNWTYHEDKRHNNGYVERRARLNEIKLGLKRVYLHRQVMKVYDPKIEIDHINRNPLDCRKKNLRIATRSQNVANRIYKKPVSGFHGVYWVNGVYEAKISNNIRRECIGYFNDPKEAAEAWDERALELRGNFTTLNFPEKRQEYLQRIKNSSK